ncbi:MAG: helix-turn-helix domain-containing protein [Lachnospiraceae bacterium]|nr:helix-turn-helix domain-containing protein [Lachnospiraceae bacterium]
MTEEKQLQCPMNLLMDSIGGKWKISLLWALKETKRFNELQKLFDGITQTMLTKQLRELERDGFVHREVYKQVPPKVEYSLTDMGKDFLPVLYNMNDWGAKHFEELKNKE